jgi:hypothetical protein
LEGGACECGRRKLKVFKECESKYAGERLRRGAHYFGDGSTRREEREAEARKKENRKKFIASASILRSTWIFQVRHVFAGYNS